MGEGACVLVLEEYGAGEGARRAHLRRGAGLRHQQRRAPHDRPPPRRRPGRARHGDALRTAGLAPEQVDYVNAHGSSTPLNDSTESRIIRAVLGEHADAWW
jgi:3-oxoacyl-[acyl-carrier-protein] synthase II